MIKLVELRSISVDRGIAITGFPGMGLVGKTVADFMIKALNAEPVVRIYSTKFPAHLIVRSNALSDINRVDIYYAKRNSIPIFIVTSDAQPLRDEDQHELSHYIVEELYKRGVKELIATAAFVTESIVERRRVFVTGNNETIVRKYIEAGAEPLQEGMITGMNGVIVGWATVYGIDAVCLLGETWRSIVELNYIDFGAAKLIVDIVSKVLDLNIDTDELLKSSQEVEREVRALVQTYLKHISESGREEREGRTPYYIT